MYEALEPFASGHLPVSDGNEIYWESSGNPKGKPALYLHGGPGAGIRSGYRKHFDPQVYQIVSFEQRGCGRSRPLVHDPKAPPLSTNTTAAIIQDIEKLREHLKIQDWLLYGSSWGTTLALAYAQAHPQKVRAIILASVTTTTAKEVDWITEQMRRIFPREWDRFSRAVNPKPNERIIDAYYRRITDRDQKIREQAAIDWCEWEDVHVSLDPQHQPFPLFKDPEFRMVFATLVIHYWKHAAFLEGPKDLLKNIGRIQHIPAVLIHGKLDVSSPLEIPWELHKAWPGSELVITENEGHGGNAIGAAIKAAADRFRSN